MRINVAQLLNNVKPITFVDWIGSQLTPLLGFKSDPDNEGVVFVQTKGENKLSSGEIIFISGAHPDLDGFREVRDHPVAKARKNGFSIAAPFKGMIRQGGYYKERSYPVFKPDDLPEKYLIRFKNSQVERMKALEITSPEKARATLLKTVSTLDRSELTEIETEAIGVVEEMAGGTQDTITWDDLAEFSALQIKIVRLELEALLQMEEGQLADINASIVEAIYSSVSTAMAENEAKAEEESDEDSPEPEEDETDPLAPES